MYFYTQLARFPLNIPALPTIDQQKTLSATQTNTEMTLLIQGFELYFYQKKQIPLDRVAAFVKRLSTLSLSLSTPSLLACLSLLKSLFIKFPKLDCLLDQEEKVGTGVYRRHLNDPELAHATSTHLWELHFLKASFFI